MIMLYASKISRFRTVIFCKLSYSTAIFLCKISRFTIIFRNFVAKIAKL